MDDVASNRTALTLMLERYGTCQAVSSGEEALKCMETAWAGGEPFDLLCLDLLMPGIGGAETFRRIRMREAEQAIPKEKQLRVICVSTSDDPVQLAAVTHQADVVHIPKPCSRKELQDALIRFGLLEP